MHEQSIFLAALEIDDARLRSEYLDEACGGDDQLRWQVEGLLAAHERSGAFLDQPALQHRAARFPGEATSGQHGADPPGEVDLSFLEPSNRPGSLGRLRHYDVQEIVGRGGCGIVLKAFDEKLQRVVAIKIMAPGLAATSPARKRFLREARATAAIRHENVVSIYAVEEQPLPFLVMEFVQGETLQQRLNRTGPLHRGDILRIGRQIADGLAAAHGKGLIHRDIKPGNILLEDGTDRLKITDFGLARTADDASVTQSGVITGTPLYMSPEQAQGLNIDHRSDLFSLGSVLYVMTSGRPPFRAGTTIAVMKRVVEERPRPVQQIIPEIPDWLVAIIAKLHAKRPQDRFASAHEVSELLSQCLAAVEQDRPVELPEDVTAMLPQQSDDTSETVASLPSEEVRAAGGLSPPARSQLSRRQHRPWAIAAAMVLMLVAGLGITEATGVTSIGSTVIRLFSPEGTLVIEVDDPATEVSIDGEEIVITGAGAKEIRLKPGQYKLLASKDGKLVRQELVTVTRDGRQVVRVSKEAGPMPPQGTTASLNRRPKFRSGGDWHIENGELTQASHGFSRLLFGDPNWTDYDFEVEAKSIGKDKDHGICLLFRARDLGNSHQIDIGGWGATVTEAIFTKDGKWGRSPGCYLKIPHEHGRWYKVKIEVRGPSIQCLVDGKSIFLFSDETFLQGMIGLGTHNAPARWRNLTVTAPDGTVLWKGFPEIEPASPAGALANPDRRAAEWVLSIGGSVRVIDNGKTSDVIDRIEDLPDSNFYIYHLILSRPGVASRDLEHLAGLQKLGMLHLSAMNIDDDTIRLIAAAPELWFVNMGSSTIHSSALKEFRQLKKLQFLAVPGGELVDDDWASLQELKSLRFIQVSGVTDADADAVGLAQVGHLRTVWFPHAETLQDETIAAFQQREQTCRLVLGERDNIRVAGRDPVRELATRLHAAGAEMELSSVGGSEILSLESTLPFRVVRLTIPPGTEIDAVTRRLLTCAELGLCNASGIKDADDFAQHLADQTHLGALNLRDSDLTDAGLKVLGGLPSLNYLDVSGTRVTAEGVQAFQAARATPVEMIYSKATETAGEETASTSSAFAHNPDAVRAELRRRNPDFKGVMTHLIEDGKVVRWTVAGGELADLSPLLALKHLKQLNYEAFDPQRDAPVVRQLASLEKINDDSAASYRQAYPANKPLQAVSDDWLETVARLPIQSRLPVVMEKLQEQNPNFDGKYAFRENDMFLTFDSRAVTDISPLAALPELQQLACSVPFPNRSWLSDLSPLAGLSLTRLECERTRIVDLSPLKGMPLTKLDLTGTPVSDLTPLKGMPLTWCDLVGTRVESLAPLAGMPLKRLELGSAPVADLSPLKGIPLEYLNVTSPKVTDLSPLRGAPLRYLSCWGAQVSDLAPLKGMPLNELYCFGTQVSDLSPLKGMPLTCLECGNSRVTDLSPLADMPLKLLNIAGTDVVDLSPLEGMPLESLVFPNVSEENRRRVRSIRSLKTINNMPADEFWKKVDAQE